MKHIGWAFIMAGAAFLIISLVSFVSRQNQLHSPIPQNRGVKVIIVTPTP